MVRSIRVVSRAQGPVAALLLVTASLALAPIALAADSTVDIVGFSYSPGSLTVTVGDTVTWANDDIQAHTATADGGAFDTGTITGKGSKALTLASAGTFPYHCTIHPAMTATLVVQAASGGGSTPPPTDAVATGPAGNDAGLGLVALAALGGAWLGLRRFARTDSAA